MVVISEEPPTRWSVVRWDETQRGAQRASEQVLGLMYGVCPKCGYAGSDRPARSGCDDLHGVPRALRDRLGGTLLSTARHESESRPFGERRPTVTVNVGGVPVGSAHPIVVQSMTNTDTADVEATTEQIAALTAAGSELVRVAQQILQALGLRRVGHSNPLFGESLRMKIMVTRPLYSKNTARSPDGGRRFHGHRD